jgi:hypothetical protein
MEQIPAAARCLPSLLDKDTTLEGWLIYRGMVLEMPFPDFRSLQITFIDTRTRFSLYYLRER